MHTLYVLSKVLLGAAAFAVAQALADDLWLPVLLLTWCAHPKRAPVGGASLFMPLLRHTEVTLILGLVAVYCLLRRRHLGFWAILSLSVFVHSIVAFHLFLAMVPPWLLRSKRLDTRGIIGLALFAVSCLVYLVTMAPPAMTAAEAHIFLSAKGTMAHVSPFNQSVLGWVRMLGLAALAWLAHRHLSLSDEGTSLVLGFAWSGTLFALVLSTLTVLSGSARLAQFQPMRVFFWVTLFVNVSLAASVVQALKRALPEGIILLAVLVLTMLNSLWATGFILLGVGYFLLARSGVLEKLASLGFAFTVPTLRPLAELRRRDGAGVVARAAVAASVGLMILAWLLGEGQPSADLRRPLPVVAGLLLLLLSSKPILTSRWRWAVFVGLTVASVAGASLFWHSYFGERLDPHWDSVRRWIRENTPKEARFISAMQPDHTYGGGNFRTLALRTALGEPQSALLWVDPLVGTENGRRVSQVKEAYDGQAWSLEHLFALADEWDAEYVVVKGLYQRNTRPVFLLEPYSVLAAD
jgi:hypothetical protein